MAFVKTLLAETLLTHRADPNSRAQIGATMVLHTWGSASTHQPTFMARSRTAVCRRQWRWWAFSAASSAGARLSRLFRRPFPRGTG